MWQYVVVTFSETRGVLIGGAFAGYTNQSLRTTWGMHTFALDGPVDYTPSSDSRMVYGTTLLNPLEIDFEKIQT